MLKENLKKITEKAKLKSLISDDMKEFAEVILKNWLEKCAEAANEGSSELILVAFEAEARFANRKIKDLLTCGLCDFIKKITELDVIMQEYIVKQDSKIAVEIISPHFNSLFENNVILHYYVIKLNWE